MFYTTTDVCLFIHVPFGSQSKLYPCYVQSAVKWEEKLTRESTVG